MKKLMFVIALFFSTVGLAQTAFADTSSPELVISEIEIRGCIGEVVTCADEKEGSFVEIYNNSPVDFSAAGWKLQYVTSNASTGAKGTVTNLAEIPVNIGGFEYVVFAHPARFAEAIPLTADIGNKTQGYIQIVDASGVVVDIVGYGSKSVGAKGGAPVVAPPSNRSIQRCEIDNGYLIDNGSNAADFSTYDLMTPGVGVRCLPPPPPANNCEGLKLSEIAANANEQFIEIYNPTANDIDLTDCQIMTNRSHNVFVFGVESLPAGGYRAIYISGSPLTLTKTTSGTVYILSGDGGSEVDSVSYANLSANTSWALTDGEWKQTYAVTPNAANVWQEYPPCEVGYERNLETGRCKKIVAVHEQAACPAGQYRNPETGRCKKVAEEAALTPCKEGQERNPETNRCRNIVTAKTLAPCKEGEERNPETNRCRKIATAATAKPCPAGQERNPTTGRCRKIVQKQAAQFAVEETPASRETGLWFWVGVGGATLVSGFMLWQFRFEIGKFFRKFAKIFAKS